MSSEQPPQPESVGQAGANHKGNAKDAFKNLKERKSPARLNDNMQCCKCYTPVCKARAGPVLNVINLVILVLGVLIFLIGCIQSGEIHAPEKVYEMIPDGFDVSQKTMGVGMIMLGIFCVALAIFGYQQSTCPAPLSTLFYIIFAGLFAFILIIIGMVLGGFAGDTMFMEIKDNLCKQSTTIKAQYNRAVNAQMCSSQCPCDGTDPEMQELWESYNAAVPDQENLTGMRASEKLNNLAYFGREFANQTQRWPKYGPASFYDWNDKVPLKFVRDGFVRTAATTVASDTNSVGAIGEFV